SRLYRTVDEPLADRRLCADPADGRHRWAALPRVRDDLVGGHHDLAGRLADDDADDVRVSARRSARTGAWAALLGQRACFRRDPGSVRPQLAARIAVAIPRDAQPIGDAVTGFLPPQD